MWRSVAFPQFYILHTYVSKKITGKCFRPEEILDSSIGYKMLGIFNQDMQLPYYNAMFSVLHFF